MSDSTNPLFLDLVDNAEAKKKQLRKGRMNFSEAMSALDLTSVFDIIRMPKALFMKRLALINDDDGDRAYENAMCYAVQIGRAYRENTISSGRQPKSLARTGIRALVDIGPSYPNLFKENWDEFCKVGAIEAVDSPVAYLRALYRLAVNRYEELPLGNVPKIPLAIRRPDLKDLIIDPQSTFKPMPMLDIVNNVLTRGIEAYRATTDDAETPLLQLLATKRYPFNFPYDFAHRQAMLGLSGKKSIALGELSYRVSLTLPTTTTGGLTYGHLTHGPEEAQRLLSGLSPEQQKILIEPSPFATIYLTATELAETMGHQRMPTASTFNPWSTYVIAYLIPVQEALKDALSAVITTAGAKWSTELTGIDPEDEATGQIPLQMCAVEDGDGTIIAPNSLSTKGLFGKTTSLIAPNTDADAHQYQGRFTLIATSENQLDGNHFGAKQFLRRTLSVNLAPIHTLNVDEQRQQNSGYGERNPLLTPPLEELSEFMSRTGLDADSVEQVLARLSYAPTVSANVISLNELSAGGPDAVHRPFPHPAHYGAGYVNGVGAQTYPKTAYSPELFDNAMNLQEHSRIDGNLWLLTNTSHDRFDRLQRMIRLQRWLAIPFNEIDTLIMSAIRSEREHNLDKQLNINTLRTLGVFNHLNGRYGIKPEEFAAFLHYLCPYASADKTPLFDKVFNQPALFETPMILDNTDFSLDIADAGSQKTIAQLCAGLNLHPSQSSFYLLANETLMLITGDDRGTGSLNRNLWTVSSLYRQARIAQLFELSVQQYWQLLDLLGGENYRQALASGQLKPVESAAAAAPDILDILMQLEWAVDWLAESELGIEEVRQWVALDTDSGPPAVQMLDRLAKLARDARGALAAPAEISALGLPTHEDRDDGVAPSLLDWAGILYSQAMPEGQPESPVLTVPDSAAEQADYLFEELLSGLQLNALNKVSCKAILVPFFLSVAQRQLRLIEGFMLEIAALPMDHTAATLRWANTSASELYRVVRAVEGPFTEIPVLVNSAQRHARVIVQLGMSELAVRTFAVFPQRLAGSPPAASGLSLHNLYLLERYCRFVETADAQEEKLLTYLELATPPTAGRDNKTSTAELSIRCATVLAPLLGWTASEVKILSDASLTDGIARSLADIDWLMRCRGASRATGLAATSLLAAGSLHADSTPAQWRVVGEAAMANQR